MCRMRGMSNADSSQFIPQIGECYVTHDGWFAGPLLPSAGDSRYPFVGLTYDPSAGIPCCLKLTWAASGRHCLAVGAPHDADLVRKASPEDVRRAFEVYRRVQPDKDGQALHAASVAALEKLVALAFGDAPPAPEELPTPLCAPRLGGCYITREGSFAGPLVSTEGDGFHPKLRTHGYPFGGLAVGRLPTGARRGVSRYSWAADGAFLLSEPGQGHPEEDLDLVREATIEEIREARNQFVAVKSHEAGGLNGQLLLQTCAALDRLLSAAEVTETQPQPQPQPEPEPEPEKPAPLTLQIGKRYVARDGRTTGLLATTAYTEWPFRDPKSNLHYRTDGSWDPCGLPHPCDLVREADPEPAPDPSAPPTPPTLLPVGGGVVQQSRDELLTELGRSLPWGSDGPGIASWAFPKATPGIVNEVLTELARALDKFPTWPLDPVHALAVVAEELGETQKEVLQLTYEPGKTTVKALRKEAIQTAAMSLRFLIGLERGYQFVPAANKSLEGGVK